MTSPTHLIPCPTATYLQVHWNFHNNNNNNDPIPHTQELLLPPNFNLLHHNHHHHQRWAVIKLAQKNQPELMKNSKIPNSTTTHPKTDKNKMEQKKKTKGNQSPGSKKEKGRELKAHQKERKPTKTWIFDEYGSFDHLQ
jgi:hypothetical protein